MSLPENLIDLGQYPRNDVELIAREYMRIAYLDTLDTFVKEFAELPEEDEKRKNVMITLEAFEHTIAVLDQSEEFLEAIHANVSEEGADDDDYERF